MPARVHMKEDILKQIRQHSAGIKALGVRRLGLFGSFARGEQHPDSDVDIRVEFEPGRKTFDSFMELFSCWKNFFNAV